MRKHGCLISTIVVLFGFISGITSCSLSNTGSFDAAEILSKIMIGLLIVGFAWMFMAYMQKTEDMKIDAKIKADERQTKMKTDLDNQVRWLSERFAIDKHIYCFENDFLLSVAVDTSERVIIIGQEGYKFSDIVGVELIKSESSVSTTITQKSNWLRRAVIGRAIAGDAGAIIGAVTAKESGMTQTHSVTRIEGVCIYLSDVINPTITIRGDETFNRDVFVTVQAIIAKSK